MNKQVEVEQVVIEIPILPRHQVVEAPLSQLYQLVLQRYIQLLLVVGVLLLVKIMK